MEQVKGVLNLLVERSRYPTKEASALLLTRRVGVTVGSGFVYQSDVGSSRRDGEARVNYGVRGDTIQEYDVGCGR
jgi:hypothetical protein